MSQKRAACRLVLRLGMSGVLSMANHDCCLSLSSICFVLFDLFAALFSIRLIVYSMPSACVCIDMSFNDQEKWHLPCTIRSNHIIAKTA